MSIAHTHPESGRTHALQDHLIKVGEKAAAFAGVWGAEEIARVSGRWHDLGKYSRDFQKMIGTDAEAHLEDLGSGGSGRAGRGKGRVNHSSAGALWAMKRAKEAGASNYGKAIAYVIAGHHAGLPDWDADLGARANLEYRLRPEQEKHLDAALDGDPPQDILETPLGKSPIRKGQDTSLYIRMLGSALFDADFLDTESFMDPEKAAERQSSFDLGQMEEALDKYLRSLEGREGTVNDIRRKVLDECRQAARLEPGLFSLTVPTGGGKTFSSLAFALAHARHHGLNRIIYAQPFTSIIEQTADAFRRALGCDNAVLEHHSALDPGDATALSRLASENWDAPLIVTTTVQLFESLFASRTRHVRKIHNIANSVLILDEAQALPAAVLRPITITIDQLARFYGVTVVLCTATQPELKEIFRGMDKVREIVSQPKQLFDALDRVRVEWVREETSLEDIAEEMKKESRVLTIVNTRRQARELHALLPKGAIHLSTWQCAAHRRRLIEQIKDPEAEVRVVSTTLVEAGVDIDFPVVFRAYAGLDSLAQAAGRCNREGLLHPEKGRFVVFKIQGETRSSHMKMAAGALDWIRENQGENCFTPEAYREYFEKFYWVHGDSAVDRYEMERLLNLGGEKPKFDLSFREAAKQFKMIEDLQDVVIVPYDDEARGAIEKLRERGPSRSLMRKLQPYSIPVSRHHHYKLGEAHVLETVHEKAVLVEENVYREDVGLDVIGLADVPLATHMV